MSKSAGILCAILGVLILIGGFGAYFYEERSWGGLVITHPHRDLGITLIVFGLVLIVVGAIIYSYTPIETRPSSRNYGKPKKTT